jgi:hypothetical protein
VQTAYFSRANAPLGFPNRFKMANPTTGEAYLTLVGNRALLSGWGYIVGDSSNTLRTELVTYGVTLAGIPITTVTLLGRKDGSNPTTPGDFGDTAGLSSGNGIWITSYGTTTTQFTAAIRVGAGTWTTNQRLGYAWKIDGLI